MEDEFEKFQMQQAELAKLEKQAQTYVSFLEERGLIYDPDLVDDPFEKEAFKAGFAKLQIDCLQLAGFQQMYEAVDESDLKEKVRLAVIRLTFLSGRWVEPWISLIDREFPGRPICVSDFEAFAIEAGSAVESELAIESEIESLRARLEQVLGENGYKILQPDKLVFVQIFMQLRLGSGIVTPEALEGNLYEIIRAGATEPSHPGWKSFVDDVTQNP